MWIRCVLAVTSTPRIRRVVAALERAPACWPFLDLRVLMRTELFVRAAEEDCRNRTLWRWS